MVAKTKAPKRGTVHIVPTEEQLLVAERAKGSTSTREDGFALTGEPRSHATDRMTVEHTTAETVWMYKPFLDKDGRPIPGAWRAVPVPATALEMNLANGFKARCPDCYQPSDPSSGRHGPGFNDCPGRKPLTFRTCRVCGKKIPDYPTWEAGHTEASTDPNEITDDLVSTLTPRQRTESLLKQHYLAYHPSYAESLGIRPQPRTTAVWAAPGEDVR